MPRTASRYQRIGLVYNPEKPRAYAEWQRLKRWLRQRRVAVMGGTRVTGAMRKCQLMVAVGGDGTVLRVARDVAAWGIPVLGVNVGRLGFLAATEVGAMYRTLARVLSGQGRVESRMLISVTGASRGRRFGPALAVNDVVVRSGATGRTLQLQSCVRGRLMAAYAGDGIIVSTPTGSTAYSLAASGPIVYPDLDVMILTPICPHSLTQRPLVCPPFEIITIEVCRPGPAALLTVDGEVLRTLWPGDQIEIRRADEQVPLMMDPERSYYQVLQSKLKWGGS